MDEGGKLAFHDAVHLGVAVDIIFLIIAGFYWTTPSGSLPSYVPGFAAGGTTIHVKHGVAALVIALAAFAAAWFGSGKKKA